MRLSGQRDIPPGSRLRFGLKVATQFQESPLMKIPPGIDRLGAPISGSIAQLGHDRRVAWVRDRSISKNTPRTPVTLNTVVVLSAIVALIAILIFLESRIRRLSVRA